MRYSHFLIPVLFVMVLVTCTKERESSKNVEASTKIFLTREFAEELKGKSLDLVLTEVLPIVDYHLRTNIQILGERYKSIKAIIRDSNTTGLPITMESIGKKMKIKLEKTSGGERSEVEKEIIRAIADLIVEFMDIPVNMEMENVFIPFGFIKGENRGLNSVALTCFYAELLKMWGMDLDEAVYVHGTPLSKKGTHIVLIWRDPGRDGEIELLDLAQREWEGNRFNPFRVFQ